jgi:hypothetical protein
MALAIIFTLYVTIGVLAAAGSIHLSQKFLPARFEPVFFGLFLLAIAGFYLAFTAYFGAADAWGLETGAVAAFALAGIAGTRIPALLIAGYAVHGAWDLLHELHAHLGTDLFQGRPSTEIPLAYGAFCAAYDWCMAAYFLSRRHHWSAGIERG